VLRSSAIHQVVDVADRVQTSSKHEHGTGPCSRRLDRRGLARAARASLESDGRPLCFFLSSHARLGSATHTHHRPKNERECSSVDQGVVGGAQLEVLLLLGRVQRADVRELGTAMEPKLALPVRVPPLWPCYVID
jgi:hypothetical protein